MFVSYCVKLVGLSNEVPRQRRTNVDIRLSYFIKLTFIVIIFITHVYFYLGAYFFNHNFAMYNFIKHLIKLHDQQKLHHRSLNFINFQNFYVCINTFKN